LVVHKLWLLVTGSETRLLHQKYEIVGKLPTIFVAGLHKMAWANKAMKIAGQNLY